MEGLANEDCGLDSKAQLMLLALLLARTRSVMELSQPRQAHGLGWGVCIFLEWLVMGLGVISPGSLSLGTGGPCCVGGKQSSAWGGMLPRLGQAHDPLPAPLPSPTGTEPSVTEPLVVLGMCPSTAVCGPSSGGRTSGAGDNVWSPGLLRTHSGPHRSRSQPQPSCRTALCRRDPAGSEMPRRLPSFCTAPMRLKVQLPAS